jgi:hypothetical protein
MNDDRQEPRPPRHKLEVDGSGRPQRKYEIDSLEQWQQARDHLDFGVVELLDHKHAVIITTRAMRDDTWEQQKKLCAMCNDMSKQAAWYGYKLSGEEWRHLVCAIIRKDQRQVPGEDGFGFIMLGGSSRDLTKAEKSLAIEMLFKLGAERKVVWKDPKVIQQWEAMKNQPP